MDFIDYLKVHERTIDLCFLGVFIILLVAIGFFLMKIRIDLDKEYKRYMDRCDFKLVQSIRFYLAFKEPPSECDRTKLLIKNEKELLIVLDYFLRKDVVLRKKLRFKRLGVKLLDDNFEIKIKSIFRTNQYVLVADSSKLLIFLGLLLEKNKNG